MIRKKREKTGLRQDGDCKLSKHITSTSCIYIAFIEYLSHVFTAYLIDHVYSLLIYMIYYVPTITLGKTSIKYVNNISLHVENLDYHSE